MSVLQQLNQDIQQVVGQTRRALVQVTNGQQGQGAGTIWHPEGMIITNAHVVGGVRQVKVQLYDHSELAAQVIGVDSERDLAILAVEAHDLPTIEVGDSRHVQAGEWVMALGHPWGVIGAVTSGPIIGFGHQLPNLPPLKNDWLVANLAMRPGHSGGAMVDTEGRLLGVNTLITHAEVGLAVPVHVVKQFLKQRIV
jgi:serine protease Do